MHSDVVTGITQLASQCIRQQGLFRIVLTGGNTPRPIYRELRTIDTDWAAWQIYFGDERCLPRGDPDRNDTMARDTWLTHVPIPAEQIHAIPAELGAESGARVYGALLTGVERFDLVLLGLGEDGHIASLFPGHPQDDHAMVVAVHDAPKPPPDRISLSASTLSRADQVWFLVIGEGKREALKNWYRQQTIPACTIRPAQGVDIFTDIDLDDR